MSLITIMFFFCLLLRFHTQRINFNEEYRYRFWTFLFVQYPYCTTCFLRIQQPGLWYLLLECINQFPFKYSRSNGELFFDWIHFWVLTELTFYYFSCFYVIWHEITRKIGANALVFRFSSRTITRFWCNYLDSKVCNPKKN